MHSPGLQCITAGQCREQLAVLEGNLAEQSAASRHQLQHVFGRLQAWLHWDHCTFVASTSAQKPLALMRSALIWYCVLSANKSLQLHTASKQLQELTAYCPAAESTISIVQSSRAGRESCLACKPGDPCTGHPPLRCTGFLNRQHAKRCQSHGLQACWHTLHPQPVYFTLTQFMVMIRKGCLHCQ